jgi:hypothetical protein
MGGREGGSTESQRLAHEFMAGVCARHAESVKVSCAVVSGRRRVRVRMRKLDDAGGHFGVHGRAMVLSPAKRLLDKGEDAEAHQLLYTERRERLYNTAHNA